MRISVAVSVTYNFGVRPASVIQVEDLAEKSTAYPFRKCLQLLPLLMTDANAMLRRVHWQVTHRLLPFIGVISSKMCV